MPPRIISANPRRVPTRTNSSVTFFASAGKMYFVNHSCRSRSSARPRNRTIGTCVWPLIRPGEMTLPVALIRWRDEYRDSISARGPMATMRPFATAMPPSSITRRVWSIVTIVPPSTSRSTGCRRVWAATSETMVIKIREAQRRYGFIFSSENGRRTRAAKDRRYETSLFDHSDLRKRSWRRGQTPR